MAAAAVALRGYVLGIRWKMKKGKLEKEKLNERNIFLSRDSCSCRSNQTRKRLPTWDLYLKQAKRLRSQSGRKTIPGSRPLVKIEENNISEFAAIIFF